ncbi:hypothetical protein PHJA_000875700 [Phtheirospermum japonicum]|uniref:Uncharacterized protein n=1 Tax=Phtheirospermum japonicum TaxID=374723 RepID=A0A830BIA3_9LAMI|nr:hypothetical protein PHJA_000875700 [Phtheirospermum japonicum]
MGTKIHCKSYLPAGFYSMRDLNDDSSTSSWPFFYGDKTGPNGPYYNGFMPMSLADGYPGHDKDALKQKMLEHEAVFKNQVCELHRLYRIQRDMMEEAKRKEINKNRASMEPASSSTFHGSQLPLDEARKWHMAGFPLFNSNYGRTSISGVEIVSSPLSCVHPGQLPFQNGPTVKDSEGPRPFKVRKTLFDLQLPADDYIDIQETGISKEYKESDASGYARNCNLNSGPESSLKLFLGGRGLKGSPNGLADLNEPVRVEEAMAPSSVDFLGRTENGFSLKSSFESKVNTRGPLPRVCDTGSTRGNVSFATQVHPLQGMWRDGPRNGLEPSDRNRDQPNNHRSEPISSSQTVGSYPFVSSSSFATSWAHSVSSWAKPTSSFAYNATKLETSLKPLNGFHHGSASGSKDVQVHLPSVGSDFLNCTRGDNNNVASDRSTNHGFGIFPKGPRPAGPKPAIDINLNEIVPEDHLTALPWLKPKPVRDSGKPEISNLSKILGIPIFERRAPENGPSTSASFDCRPEEKNVVTNERNNGLIDINVACEPDEQIIVKEPIPEKENNPRKGAFIIDLNSCVSDCEDPQPPGPKYERKTASVKITLEIDLEVPVFLETDDDDDIQDEVSLKNKEEKINDVEVLRNAAETMVAISSWGPPGPQIDMAEASLAEALLWLVEARSSEEILDDFEAMTLKLTEMKEEDYMPKPFILEKTEEENGPKGLAPRARRGQSRRGRQRRDFQRDILPGLTTLSRHEMTEDLQTFGGLMRATGHSWNSGLTRRNGSGRGRRRAAGTVVVENVACAAAAVAGPVLCCAIAEANLIITLRIRV